MGRGFRNHPQNFRFSHGAESSTFFGFMKVSSGASAAEMEKELAREKRGGSFLFSAIINQGEPNFDFAKVVPFSSDTDFTIRQFDQAKSMVSDRLVGRRDVSRKSPQVRFRPVAAERVFSNLSPNWWIFH